jgi:hypothetical protein
MTTACFPSGAARILRWLHAFMGWFIQYLLACSRRFRRRRCRLVSKHPESATVVVGDRGVVRRRPPSAGGIDRPMCCWRHQFTAWTAISSGADGRHSLGTTLFASGCDAVRHDVPATVRRLAHDCARKRRRYHRQSKSRLSDAEAAANFWSPVLARARAGGSAIS